jgi:predicted nucleic acid-binding protein
MIFVDTNILIDVVENDPIWADWSQQQLQSAAALGEVAINDVVYAELAVGYQSPDDLDSMIVRLGIAVLPIPRIALFIAGKAYQRYRLEGGLRTGVLPDFFLGAQALVAGAQLITRDVRRYRTYFPDLALVAPAAN